jgi:hypothetical protein
MSFSDNKSLQKVAEKYKIATGKKDFMSKIPDLELNHYFIENLKEGMKLRKTNSSEYFLCEFLISPLLFEILKKHHKLNLWSHDCYIDSGEPDLSGTPDYIVSYKGDTDDYEQLHYPLLTLADAKKDDFAGGWAQTLAEMIACQKLNKSEELPIYGIVTNGTLWEFGIFKKDTFVLNTISYSIGVSLNKIAGILNYIYSETTKNVEKYFVENNITLKIATNIF